MDELVIAINNGIVRITYSDVFQPVREHLAALDLITGSKLSNVISDSLIFGDDKVYLEDHWPKHICRRGGLEKYNFIGLQLELFDLQEKIESGEVKCQFFVNGEEYVQAWQRIDRKGRDKKQYIKSIKKHNHVQKIKKNCPPWAKEYRKTGCVPLCCMCNENLKTILRKSKSTSETQALCCENARMSIGK